MQNGSAAQLLNDRVACSTAEYARATGVSPRTVKNWIKRGEVASYLVGRRRLIPVTELTRQTVAE